jgi:hypothetical protein
MIYQLLRFFLNIPHFLFSFFCFPVGRDANLPCVVEHLGSYKVIFILCFFGKLTDKLNFHNKLMVVEGTNFIIFSCFNILFFFRYRLVFVFFFVCCKTTVILFRLIIHFKKAGLFKTRQKNWWKTKLEFRKSHENFS